MTRSSSKRQKKNHKNVLLGVTASIAAYKACEMICMLRKKGYTVKCVMSPDAKWFITPLTLETLSGNKVVQDMFSAPETRNPEHIALAEEADAVVVAPATADIIGKVASGICDDILSCVICATKKPVIFAPAMNDNMFTNPIIRDKIAYLKSKGYHFVDPVVGHLACGREGVGHIAGADQIIKKIESFLA